MRPELLVQIVFGWPVAIASLLASLTGLIRRRYQLLLIGAVLIIPSSYYLSGAPGSYRLPFLLPLFALVSAYAVNQKKMLAAWLFFLPVLLAVAFFLLLFIYAQSMSS
jgi:hypothetical protein